MLMLPPADCTTADCYPPLQVQRSRERNLDWMNDETLRRSAVGVCPTSAKLQLQVGVHVCANAGAARWVCAPP